MKAKFAQLTLIAALSAAGATTAFAHEDYSEGGGLHWLSHVAETKSTPEAVAKERASQKNMDRGKDNHEEGVGGHGLYEATKKKP